MADIKTHLRELSVAVTVGLLLRKYDFCLNELYNSDRFIKYAKEIIENDISSASNLLIMDNFSPKLCQIINNGYNLGEKIYQSDEFDIDEFSVIQWKGNDTQKDDPVDIVIGKYGFSLKEESFILEYMGLYKLLNCFTGSTYRKRHIFKDYALYEYRNWFSVTWNEMLKDVEDCGKVWCFDNIKKLKKSIIKITDNDVIFEYYDNKKLIANSILPKKCTLEMFEDKTSSKTREKVFSKFINQILDNNPNYNNAKRECAIVATKNLAKELTENLNYSAGIPRFLRIHEFSYYYAKTTANGSVIYKVPALADFKDNIVIDSIVSSVPNKQANILTTIRNKRTGKKLILRNECRFSHGQFNGTPEAKMYYEQGGSLLVIYEPI